MKFKLCALLLALMNGICLPCFADYYPTRSEVDYPSRTMAMRFSHDGQRLVSAGFITDKKDQPIDKRLRVWDVKSGREIHRLPAKSISPNRFNYGGDERGSNTLIMPNFDLMLTTWGSYDVKTVQIHSARFGETLAIRSGVITDLELSPDEKTVAIATRDFVQFRDARTLKLLRTYASATGANEIHFGPDSSTILVDSLDGVDVQGAYWIGEPVWLPRIKNADAYAFSPDGKRVARTKGQTIEIWTTPTRDPNYVKPDDMGHKLKTLKTVLPVVWRLQFSPDGKTLAAGGLSKTLTPVEFFALSK